jgi:hypothetical protein
MQDSTLQKRPAALTVHRVCRALSLLVWEGTAPSNLRRLQVLVDGTRVKPPFTHLSLPIESGGRRCVLAVGSAVAGSFLPTIEIAEADGRILASSRNQPNLAHHEFDALGLVTGLSAAERARLARFLLEVCSFLFRISTDPTFVANARILLLEIAAGSGRLVARCALPGNHLLCEALVPAAIGERLSAVLVGAEAVERVAAAPRLLASASKRPDLAGLGIVVERRSQAQSTLIVIFGDNGLVCRRLADSPRVLPNAHEYFARVGESGASLRHYLLDCLAKHDPASGRGASLLRELRLLSREVRKSGDGHGAVLSAAAELIVGCENGLFVSGRLTDPHRLVEALLVERDGIAQAVPTEALTTFRVADGGGCSGPTGFAFFAHQRDGCSPIAPARVLLGLRSGARIEVGEGPTLLHPEQACEAILASVPCKEAQNEALLALLEKPILALFAERLAKPIRLDAHDLGEVPAHPLTSIVIPFNADPDLLRSRASLFALDPAMAEVEVVYVVESTEQCQIAMRLLADFQAAYGTPCRVIAPDRPLPMGALLNIGARSAQGQFITLLGATVLPESVGWLDTLVSFLAGSSQRGIVGGKPLYEDQSLVAAGWAVGTDDLGRWALTPQLGGFPRDFPSACVPRRAAALSADCLVIRRTLLEQAEGLEQGYFLADTAGADLCLRVRALGRDVCWFPTTAVFRIERRTSAEADGHSLLRAELDRRTLERRWRDSFEREPGMRGNAIAKPNRDEAGAVATPLRRAA